MGDTPSDKRGRNRGTMVFTKGVLALAEEEERKARESGKPTSTGKPVLNRIKGWNSEYADTKKKADDKIGAERRRTSSASSASRSGSNRGSMRQAGGSADNRKSMQSTSSARRASTGSKRNSYRKSPQRPGSYRKSRGASTRVAPGGAKPVKTPPAMGDTKGLTSSDPWKRAAALATMTQGDLLDESVLSSVVSLLKDLKTFQEPERISSDSEKRLVQLLRQSENRQSRWNTLVPDIQSRLKAEGNPIYSVSNIAMRVLIRAEPVPVASDEKTATMLGKRAMEDKNSPYLTRTFLDQQFRRFNWTDEGKAMAAYAKQVLSTRNDPTILTYIVKEAKKEGMSAVLAAVFDAAAKRSPPDYDIMVRLTKGAKRDAGHVAFLEGLERHSKVLHKDLLPPLLSTATKDGCGKRSLALMKKIEDSGCPLAGGYISLVDSAAGKRFIEYLRDDKKSKSHTELSQLLRIARDAHWPVSFPAAETFARADRDVAIRWVLEWRAIPEDLRIETLRRMADVSKYPRMGYEPLFELAKRGEMRKNKELAAKLWRAVRDALSASDDWRIRNPRNIMNHPLVVLAMENPLGMMENMVAFMRDGLIKPSVFSFCMPKHWMPTGADRAAYASAVEEEVATVERVWEKQKGNKGLAPRDTVIFLLKEKWAPMIIHCTNMGDMQPLVQRMESLSRASAAQFQR